MGSTDTSTFSICPRRLTITVGCSLGAKVQHQLMPGTIALDVLLGPHVPEKLHSPRMLLVRSSKTKYFTTHRCSLQIKPAVITNLVSASGSPRRAMANGKSSAVVLAAFTMR